MPEPLLYVKTFAVTLVASALFVLAITRLRAVTSTRVNLVCVAAIAIGLLVGFTVMQLQWAWPPASALDRFLTIILPAVLGIESIASLRRTPHWVAWGLRFCLAVASPRILIHQSVYLSETGDWTIWQTYFALLVCSVFIGAVWLSLYQLSLRSPEAVSIPLSLCMSIQAAGVSVMLAGYIKGGAVAIPLTAAILGTVLAAGYVSKRSNVKFALHSDALIGISVVSLFAVLFIGHFFGRLSMASAITMMIAPVLCWVSETPGLRDHKKWNIAALRGVCVAIPLIVVLMAAKRNFDRSFAPLVENGQTDFFYNVSTQAFPTALEYFSLPTSPSNYGPPHGCDT